MTIDALLDSNVVIATIAEARGHLSSSLALLVGERGHFAIAAHSYAEAYSTLT